MLIASLGEAGAKQFLDQMQAAARSLSTEYRSFRRAGLRGERISGYINELYPYVKLNPSDHSHSADEAERQCALGNPAACP
jgi:hypothetical protein